MTTTISNPTKQKRTVIGKAPGFNTELFLETVVEGLGEDYMGYAFLLQDGNGERIIEAEFGLARTAAEADGLQPFNIRTKTAWGSVSKMATFTAGMHRIEAMQNKPPELTTNPPFAKPSLTAKMKDFLPLRWRKILHAEFQEVTIEMLMQHRAGFKKSGSSPIWDRLANGPETNAGVGTRKYSNTSASMFQSMPFFFDPVSAHHAEEALKNVPDDDYNVEVDRHSKLIYQNYVQANIWNPLNIRAKCNDVNFPKKNYAMFYESPLASNGKLLQPNLDNPKCAPGGWVLSALSMGKFVHALTATDKIISPANYALMANTADVDQRLAWLSVHEFADGTGFSHNGARFSGKVKAEMMVIPNGFTAVGAMNSKPPDGFTSLKALFIQAYTAALT